MTITASAIGIDPYGFAETHLSGPARAALAELAGVLDREVRPLMADAWETATMPDGVLDALIPLNLMEPRDVPDHEARSSMFAGFRNYVLARADVSVATVYNAQSGLFRTACALGGAPEQAENLDPEIRSFALKGVFALTEPDHGSDIAGGMATTARRDGAHWVLDGAKRWIGGASSADVFAVFARDIADGQVKAFIVPRDAPGVALSPISGKIALRPMQNAVITLTGVRVSESNRLQGVNSWRDVSRILRAMRSDVAWIAAGLQAGALEATLSYVRKREQFGKPIGGFQLIQEKLARMLGNTVASLAMVVQLSARQDAGDFSDENSALAKMWTALHARETVALAREILGGNGILLEHDVARFFADAEAVYSYEGTHEINSLIVGRALTGQSAFA
ncbi:acyl-CoA dehydrogenase family protein [Arthrobacter sp. zg-ZUI100]|uniref:Acyl-CoA dehydrogenase family protein n=1 Tax=Arthrobacter jiangjiafuii TaxID=2817475 RepID=A0A975M4Q2_9MICC|nr:acyl-CoA dehydrogenase family protein [Arthrobacter jiangjiafuii]MBP3035403.1 acyl-CoA dehydrogenase family protein [Arthrobacter jiangjiafuii]MBP3042397.1 acyl-CoA dehydrogenase family protein [Arthrobacter jiangjiafuii]QWC09852.1 acyl-CoA dehydrogenase family protein [Arthrobacter jiangjiafuii]